VLDLSFNDSNYLLAIITEKKISKTSVTHFRMYPRTVVKKTEKFLQSLSSSVLRLWIPEEIWNH